VTEVSHHRELAVGTHRVVFEGGGYVHVSFIGDYTANDHDLIFERMDSVEPEAKRRKLLINIREMGKVPPDARKRISEAEALGATALYGGGFGQRLIANMMLRAIAMVQKNAVPTRMFPGEAEARAWLDATISAA